MKHVILTAAAMLLAGTTLAGAQGMDNRKEGAAPAPAAQQRAPAEKIAPAHNAQTPRAGKPAETTGQAQREPVGKVDMKDNAETKGQANKADVDMKGSAATKMNDDKAGNKSALDTKTKIDEKSKVSADDKTKAGDEKNKSTAQDNKQDNKQDSKTTGQGAAGARAANLSTEQRTKISTVIKEKVHVQPLTHVNFSISIGTRVPRDVHFYPLPPDVISYYPAWRGYEFVMVGNEILVIDPATFEIVEIIT
jgi:hypothetical protein